MTDYLIIGQGLCGTWLSHYLMQAGASVMVVDKGTQKSASCAASGIINPITGKRLARQWMGETILPFAKQAYTQSGRELGKPFAAESSIHTFFSSAAEAEFFEQKAITTHEDLLHYSNVAPGAAQFNYHYGVGTIHPVLLLDVDAFISAQREKLLAGGVLREESFDWSSCSIHETGVYYKDISVKVVIDCTGATAVTSPYFYRLPFALNKGEAILASIPGLPRNAIYKYAQLSIVPWDENRFWIGSTYDWDFTDELPTHAFREKVVSILGQWLKLPYSPQEHFAAIRPATITRDAFSGLHPHYPQIGILNGMGSKGCSLAPFLAHNLAEHLVNGLPLIAQVDVRRFERILSV